MKKIKVEIRCSRKIYYNQQVEMEKEDFDKVKGLSGEDIMDNGKTQQQFSVIEGYINPHDVFDALNEFESVEVSLVKTKKKS